MKTVSIGLTGGIGCGKSVVAEILEGAGWRRLDTDLVAREVVKPGTPGLLAIVDLFGEHILQPTGKLDRAALGAIVFSDPEQRARVEAILHPRIWSVVEAFLEQHRQGGEHSVVEVPLLFENERQSSFSSTWTVSTTPELQRERLKLRNAWSPQEIESRISSQMPLALKAELADVVITNDGDLDALRERVLHAAQNTIGVMNA